MPCRESSRYLVMAHRGETHGSNTPTSRTVGIATELARRDAGGEYRRDGFRRTRTDSRTGRRIGNLIDEDVMHVKLRKNSPQTAKLLRNLDTLRERKNFAVGCPALRSEETKPDLLDGGIGAPKQQKRLQIARPGRNLGGNRCMDRDLRSSDVFENASGRSRLPALIMFGLSLLMETTADIQVFVLTPRFRYLPEGTRDDLANQIASFDLGNEFLELPVAHEWISSNKRYMKRPMLIEKEIPLHLSGFRVHQALRKEQPLLDSMFHESRCLVQCRAIGR